MLFFLAVIVGLDVILYSHLNYKFVAYALFILLLLCSHLIVQVRSAGSDLCACFSSERRVHCVAPVVYFLASC
jgi:hypothetical protein